MNFIDRRIAQWESLTDEERARRNAEADRRVERAPVVIAVFVIILLIALEAVAR